MARSRRCAMAHEKSETRKKVGVNVPFRISLVANP
jgi:hypothetical protein